MNVLNVDKKELVISNTVNLSKSHVGLEYLYIGHKYAQYLGLEINTTPDMEWDRLMEDYLLTESIQPQENNRHLVYEQDEINLQLQLRELNTHYLNNISPKLNKIFYTIKEFANTYTTYFNDYLKPAIKNSKDGNYRVILQELVEDEIQPSKQKTTDFIAELTEFLKEVEKNFIALHRKETTCTHYLNDFKLEIDLLLKKINALNEKTKEENIRQIKECYATNSIVVFSEQKPIAEKDISDEKNDPEILKQLEENLKKYDKNYAILVKLVYLATMSKQTLSMIRLGAKTLFCQWETIESFFQNIETRLENDEEKVIDEILQELETMNEACIEIQGKFNYLDKALSIKFSNADDLQKKSF